MLADGGGALLTFGLEASDEHFRVFVIAET
jgi:hypothetical protein